MFPPDLGFSKLEIRSQKVRFTLTEGIPSTGTVSGLAQTVPRQIGLK
jgi:hypothetical protein